jgi:hypothetical protein
VAKSTSSGHRFIGLALMGGAVPIAGIALAIFAGVVPVGEDIRGTLAGVLALVAAVDLLAGFWFLRSSLSA